MLAFHVKFLRHLVAIIGKEIVVKRFVVTCNTTTDAGCMSSKHCCHLREMLVYIKNAKTGHPFIAMIDNLLTLAHYMLVETFHNQCCSIREHRRLIIIAIGMETINLIVIPKLAVDLVFFLVIRLEVNQNRHRLAWNGPSAHLYFQALFQSFCFPLRIKRIILREIRVHLISPTIRTNKD